jgi:ketosteroid isomerase-like protein
MRNLIITSALSVGVLSGQAAAQTKTPYDNKAAITAIEERMAGEQTVDNVLGAWDKDAVWFDITPGDTVGIDAIRKSFAGQLSHLSNIRVTILRLKVEADVRLGYAFSTVHLAADGTNGAPGINVVIRQTDTFRKIRGSWVLTHQHISLPVDLATGKAVLDSR